MLSKNGPQEDQRGSEQDMLQDDTLDWYRMNAETFIAGSEGVDMSAQYRPFLALVAPGGLLIINSSLVPEKAKRDDIRVCYIPANDDAMAIGNDKAANMVMLGAILKETGIVQPDTVREEIRHMFSGRKEKFLPMNLAAFDLYLNK